MRRLRLAGNFYLSEPAVAAVLAAMPHMQASWGSPAYAVGSKLCGCALAVLLDHMRLLHPPYPSAISSPSLLQELRLEQLQGSGALLARWPPCRSCSAWSWRGAT